jgi:hypothetical protein
LSALLAACVSSPSQNEQQGARAAFADIQLLPGILQHRLGSFTQLLVCCRMLSNFLDKFLDIGIA